MNNADKILPLSGTHLDIAEHQQVQEALKESEHALRAIFDNAHDAIFIHSADGKILDVNQKMLDLYGVSREQALQSSIVEDFSTPDNPLNELEERWERVVAGETLLFEWKARRPNDGSSFDVEVALKNITLGNSPVVLANVRDITRQKATETVLRENEEKLRALLENNLDAIMRFDRQHRHLYVNAIVEKETGIPAGEFIGRTHEELGFPKPLCSLWEKALEQVFKTGEVHRIEFQLPKGMWIDWMLIPELDESGQVKAIITSSRDITHRIQAEEALRESEKRFRDLSEMLPEVVFETDPNLNLTYANRRALELFGYSPEELNTLNGFDVIAPEDRDRAKANIALRLEGSDPGKTEYQGLKKDGSKFPMLLHANAIQQKEGKITGFRGVIVDLTERKEAEEEKARLMEQFHQAQKLDSIGRLAGGVAHDLNNLLSPILGYGELLMDDLSSHDPKRETVDEILSAGYRARDLVRQLLAFSRKQTLDYKRLNLNETIKDFESLLRRTIREDIDIEIIPSSDLPTVKADIGQIMQIIMNLSVNAQDAMPDGGKLILETSTIDIDRDYAVSHPGSKVGRYVMLAVSDTGCGMDEDTRKNIFEPFFSTKGDQGTGLGLATVYGIVRQHEGNIWVYSEPGKGTTFKIYLPVSEMATAEKKADEKPQGELAGSGTILLVEDDEQVRHLTHTILQRQGYKVLPARSGTEALSILARQREPVKLLLTDVVMPEMNGRELFEKVAEKNPDMRVLYISGYTNDVIAQKGILNEGIQFLPKPFTVQGLAVKVREILGPIEQVPESLEK